MRNVMVGALCATMLIAGCGSASSYRNTARPPAPINVAVSLTNERVQVSPARIGAGPVVLLVANEGDKSRDLTLAPPAGAKARSCVAANASSGPINPQGTVRVSVDLREGDCILGVRGAGLRPARLVVAHERTSAQADLLTP